MNIIGIDNDLIRIIISRIKAKFLKQKVAFKKKDLFKEDLKNADIIYSYQWWSLMPKIERKLKRELKKGSIVITNTTYFPNWKPTETYIIYPDKPDFEKLFLYIKK